MNAASSYQIYLVPWIIPKKRLSVSVSLFLFFSLSVVESDFYPKLKKLDVQEGKKDKLFADHVTEVRKAHNRVIVFFL